MSDKEYRTEALKARVTAINKCAELLAAVYSDYEDVLSYSDICGHVPLDKFVDDCMKSIKRAAWSEYDNTRDESNSN